MRMQLKSLLVIGALCAAVPAMAQPAGFPTRPITLVVPAPAGGMIDSFVLLLAEQFRRELGQPLVMDHRGGAGGIVGAKYVAGAAPDGYTLLMGNIGPLAILPGMEPNIGYDAAKDFAPVSMVATFSNVLVVHPSVPAQSVGQVIAQAKANPGKMTYASPGVGQSQHLSGELFKMVTGTNLLHVPYKGAAGAMNDLLGGHVNMMFSNVPLAVKHIQSGTLRPLAVTGSTRSRAMPNVPTMEEAGVKGYNVTSWIGVVAPAGTPQPIIARLNAVVARAMQSEAGKAQLERVDADWNAGTPAEFGNFILAEQRKWREVIKKADIKPQ
ncbi:MAG: tripartite tricarboxylate transporter substrate binding protein [Burkholderiaceae bacterium]|nr:tripartite tricarboxylate transporter substrate binding protein [Burkholderiaceae bacterium]MDO9089846.1 tripartite tricarboxylate transporter substrate binding protein [Burkholderiaceae bacterium]MDP1968071.1 tripartite tricarboxylate transporter substrate binding protein [Burkholderiaceae bacterium]